MVEKILFHLFHQHSFSYFSIDIRDFKRIKFESCYYCIIDKIIDINFYVKNSKNFFCSYNDNEQKKFYYGAIDE